MQGIEEAGFTDCLPVQERTYEHTLKGKDVMVQSQTGSGKTAAFLVSIYQLFTEDSYKYQKRALIIAPTRELAVQIEDEAKILGIRLPFRSGCFYGGVGYEQQEHLLQKGVDISSAHRDGSSILTSHENSTLAISVFSSSTRLTGSLTWAFSPTSGGW